MAYLKVAAATSVSIPTTTETAAVNTPLPQYGTPGDNGCLIAGNIILTAGTAGTAATIRVRQGVGTGGTVIGGANPVPVTAGATSAIPFVVFDPSPPAVVQYTVTVQQTAATGNGTALYAVIAAEEVTEK